MDTAQRLNEKGLPENLWYTAVDVKPRDMDWSEGYTETWDYVRLLHCNGCADYAPADTYEGDSHQTAIDEHNAGTDEDNQEPPCDGFFEYEEDDGPMMNYFYPVPDLTDRMTTEEAAAKISDLPLCVVTLHNGEEYGLALTGGGMDLSWEICEAYLLLGYVPPSSAILCRSCFDREIAWRAQRNREGVATPFDCPLWVELKVYGGS